VCLLGFFLFDGIDLSKGSRLLGCMVVAFVLWVSVWCFKPARV
jgi:hypothetical protein